MRSMIAMEFIKKAQKTSQSRGVEVRETVEMVIKDIESRGEAAVRELALKFDKWEGEFVLGEEKKNKLIATVDEQVKDDIKFAHEQIRNFALAQRNSLQEFEVSNFPGVKLGQRIIPMSVAGCYVPSGRFAHVCSALMSVATAKAAGVPTVIACSPPRGASIDRSRKCRHCAAKRSFTSFTKPAHVREPPSTLPPNA